MKKKILIFSLLLVLIFSSLAFASDERPTIYINGTNLDLEGQEIILKNDRYFLPLRYIAEKLGYQVTWKEGDRSIILRTEKLKVLMQIDSENYKVNNFSKTMDVSPFIENDLAYVPVRFLGEALGKEVTWKDPDNIIYINDKTFQGDDSLDKYLDKEQVFKTFMNEPLGSSVPRLAYANSKYSIVLNYNGILVIDHTKGVLVGAIDNRALGYNLLQGDDYVSILGNADDLILIKKGQDLGGYVYSIKDNKMKFYENAGSFDFKEAPVISGEEEKNILDKVDNLGDFAYSSRKFPEGMVFLEINTTNKGASKILVLNKTLKEITQFQLSGLKGWHEN